MNENEEPENWKIPLSEIGSPLDFGVKQYLYPEIEGYAVMGKGQILIPLVTSYHPRQFLKFMALVEAYDPPVVFTSVINSRLESLLRHRGWRVRLVFDGEIGEEADEWYFEREKRSHASKKNSK